VAAVDSPQHTNKHTGNCKGEKKTDSGEVGNILRKSKVSTCFFAMHSKGNAKKLFFNELQNLFSTLEEMIAWTFRESRVTRFALLLGDIITSSLCSSRFLFGLLLLLPSSSDFLSSIDSFACCCCFLLKASTPDSDSQGKHQKGMSSLEQPWLWLAAAAALQIQRWKEKEKEYLNNVKVSVEER
jgi:hypothetical protein